MSPKETSVGTRLARLDARSKVDGTARYADDLVFPGMLHAACVSSPHPHAIVRGIDTKAAAGMPGVHAIVTARDIPGKNLVPLVIPDLTLLADPRVRYVGDPVAVVVADTPGEARAAARAVAVEYEVLPAVLDAREALQPEAPAIHEGGNSYGHLIVRNGDVDRAFAEPGAVVVEGEYLTPYQEHAYLETNGMIAVPEADGAWTIHGCMQCPFYVHAACAQILGVASARIRVVQTTTGGGFGGKEDVPSIVAGLAAVAAHKVRRPVKLVLSRAEDIATMSKRHPAWVRYRSAARKDGTLTAMQCEFVLDGGGYATLSPVVLYRALVHAAGPYVCPNVHIDGRAAATNKVPCGAFRGFGTLQVIFAHETQMDRLAEAIGMDPIAFRRKNALRVGTVSAWGQTLNESVGLVETMDRAKARAGWREKRAAWGQAASDGPLRRGIGVSSLLYGVGLGAKGKPIDRAAAWVQVERDATARVAVGHAEMGQGLRTVLSQICAEVLGLDPTHVHTLDSDTSRVPDSGPTVASRGTLMSGNAIRVACETIRERLLAVAAALLDVPAERLAIEARRIVVQGEADRALPVAEVVQEAHARRVDLSAPGYLLPPDTHWDEAQGQGRPYEVYTYATNVAEVEVDTETGEVRVIDLTAALDVGRAINPTLVEGQIQGGSLQGLGFALTEDILMDGGRILNDRFSTYIIPTAMDVPEIHPIIVEHPYAAGPFGAKGIGEVPAMGIAPAITNAIHHATGVRVQELPVTPERLRALLRDRATATGRTS